jgi:hypothetical protein
MNGAKHLKQLSPELIWAECLLAVSVLLFGLFGVANIMFVSVKERTSQIGLKKAIGAKSHIILIEFLLEAAFLCLIGGFIGLALVLGLTKILSGAFNFPVYISTSNLVTAISILLCSRCACRYHTCDNCGKIRIRWWRSVLNKSLDEYFHLSYRESSCDETSAAICR